MFGALLRILALTRKELLAVLKDRRSRLSLLIPPVVQALIFGYAATYDLNHVTYALLDQDHSAASRQLLAGRSADVQLIADGRNSNTAGTAMGYVTSIVEQFNSDWVGEHGWTAAP